MKRLNSDNFSGPLGEARVASTTGGGTALTTTASIVGLPIGTSHVALLARNFTTAVVVKFALNPYLLILKTTNLLGSVTDYSANGQKNPAVASSIVLDALDTLVNSNALFIGSHLPFRGIAVTMSASVNAIAATLAVNYWNGTAWTAVTGFTDGTASAGATFAATGNITWTVPTAWTTALLPATTGLPTPISGWTVRPNTKSPNPPVSPAMVTTISPYSEKARYWLRLDVSAALSATVAANTMFAMNRSTTYAEMVQDSLLQFRTDKRVDGVSALELLTDAGTANAIVNVYTDPGVAF